MKTESGWWNRGLGEEVGVSVSWGQGVSLGGWKVLELEGGDSCTTDERFMFLSSALKKWLKR